jgi:GDP-L-fucose synthase
MNGTNMEKTDKIIVTGGSGFLGLKVVAQLKASGYKSVFVPRSKEYDLTEQAAVRKLMRDVHPQVIIHLAATVGGIGANRANPGKFCYDNMMMGAMLMEEARLAAVDKFVCIGTICSYPKFANIPFKEEELWSGYPEETNAPYGLAKKLLLVQGQAFRQQYGFNAIYLLPVNLYGPGDNFDLESSHVVPAMIRKCVDAKQKDLPFIELWGDGSPTREFLYVDDAARGIVLAAEKYNGSEPINLGAGAEISIKDLAAIIKKAVGYQGEIRWDTSKPNGQPRRMLDVSRAKKEFGFEAQVPFEEGLKRSVEWYVAQSPSYAAAH